MGISIGLFIAAVATLFGVGMGWFLSSDNNKEAVITAFLMGIMSIVCALYFSYERSSVGHTPSIVVKDILAALVFASSYLATYVLRGGLRTRMSLDYQKRQILTGSLAAFWGAFPVVVLFQTPIALPFFHREFVVPDSAVVMVATFLTIATVTFLFALYETSPNRVGIVTWWSKRNGMTLHEGWDVLPSPLPPTAQLFLHGLFGVTLYDIFREHSAARRTSVASFVIQTKEGLWSVFHAVLVFELTSPEVYDRFVDDDQGEGAIREGLARRVSVMLQEFARRYTAEELGPLLRVLVLRGLGEQAFGFSLVAKDCAMAWMGYRDEAMQELFNEMSSSVMRREANRNKQEEIKEIYRVGNAADPNFSEMMALQLWESFNKGVGTVNQIGLTLR